MLNYLLMRANMALKNKKGQGLVEYALIIALVAIIIVGSLQALEGGIAGVFADIVTALS